MGTTDDGSHGLADNGAECPDRVCVTGDWELALVLSAHWTVPLRARFTYCVDDPYAVRLDFYLGSQRPVRWVFARELLTRGLVVPAGLADVRVRPTLDPSLVSLCLDSQHGDALFEISVAPLTEWLRRTYQLVPPGEEHEFLDVDALLERLLAEPAPENRELGNRERPDGPYEHPRDASGFPGERDDGPEDAQEGLC